MSWEGYSDSTKSITYEGNESWFEFSIDTTQVFTKEQDGTRVIITYTDDNVLYSLTYSFIIEVKDFFVVQGVVYDSYGEIIEDAVVNIRKYVETIYQTTTNANGEFYFEDVVENNYNLVVRLFDDNENVQRIVERINVNANSETENKKLEIKLLTENITTLGDF